MSISYSFIPTVPSSSIPPSITFGLATSSQFYINVKNDTVVPTTDDTGAFTITNTGTGSVSLVTDATRGKVLYFAGTHGLITNYPLPIIHTRLFWVNLTNTTQANNTLSVSKRPLWFSGTNYLNFDLNYVSTMYSDTANTVVTGTWYLYALTYDGTTAKLYRNGVLDLTVTVASYATPEVLWIGYFGNFLNGYLDNIRCYGAALSQQQIQNIYNYELANPTSFYYENGYTSTSIGYSLTVSATPQAFSSNTLTVTSAPNSFQNGTYIASASSYAVAGAEAFNTLDGNISNVWHSAYNGASVGSVYNQMPYNTSGVYQGGNTNGLCTWTTTVQSVGSIGGEWVQIQLPYKLQLSTYTLYPPQDVGANWATRYPTIYYIVGSTDGTTWYQVDYRTFSAPITPSLGPLTYNIGSNTNYYSYFRLITNKVQAGASGDAVAHYSDWNLTGYFSTI